MKRSTALALLLVLGCLGSRAASAQVYPYPYPYPYAVVGPDSSLRLVVTPREAMVYVDGYLAGTVDDFDGVFQRLHVAPGEHEITLYLQGYRTIRQRLYLSPNGSRKITDTMEKLGPGEVMEPQPVPLEPPQDPGGTPPREPLPGRGGSPPPGGRDETRVPEAPVRGGSIVLRIQPEYADVTIDGEPWRGPASGDDRLVVQVSEGRHHIEVRKEGYVAFTTDVDVRRGESMAVNVSLARDTR